VGDAFTALPAFAQSGTFLNVQVICQNCAHTVLVNAAAAGLVERGDGGDDDSQAKDSA
jgi:hypothetical protein